jgi:protein-tyrosine phosphatase
VNVPSAVVDLQVDTQPDGVLTVHWAVEGQPTAVDVATGSSADHLQHAHETTVPAGQTTLQLPGRGTGRPFVSVTPHEGGPAAVAADRRVPFEGITNFRDLGGYRTRSGDRIRWGLVFRADALHGLSPRDLALYEQLGLRAVFDLRGELEREERPNPVPSRLLTIVGRPPDVEAAVPVPGGTTIADGEQILHDMYLGLMAHAALQIGQLYTSLATDDGLPAVFHCHAGKDRTGLVAALLLEALGVERDLLLDDYELTARYRLRVHQESSYQRLVESGVSPEAAAGVLTAPRWAMASALDDLDTRYGGVESYLTGPAGMRPGDLRDLRRRLVGPGPY